MISFSAPRISFNPFPIDHLLSYSGLLQRIYERPGKYGGEIKTLFLQVKQYAPIVSNCMVIGDKMKFLSLVCTLRCVMNDAHEPQDDLDWISLDQCKKLGSTATTGQLELR